MTEEEKKDMQLLEIRGRSGRISMLYLPKKKVALWDQVRKEMLGEEARVKIFKIIKKQKKDEATLPKGWRTQQASSRPSR